MDSSLVFLYLEEMYWPLPPAPRGQLCTDDVTRDGYPYPARMERERLWVHGYRDDDPSHDVFQLEIAPRAVRVGVMAADARLRDRLVGI